MGAKAHFSCQTPGLLGNIWDVFLLPLVLGGVIEAVPSNPLMQDTDPVRARAAAAKAMGQRMKALGLSRQGLSQRTGIPMATLEALEQGGSGRLPADRHWNARLKALADAMQLPIRTVQAAAWRPPSGRDNGAGRRLERFWNALVALKGQIDLDGGQGLVIYGLLVALLLYGLNLQQRRLAADNLLSLEPIAPLPLDIHLSNTPVRLAEQVETLNPAVEFQPLARLEDPAVRRQLLREALQPLDQEPRPGLLDVTVTSPAQVTIVQQGTVHAQLKVESGVLRWRLQPALAVTVVPADGAVVRWNSQPLIPLDETRGLFRVAAP